MQSAEAQPSSLSALGTLLANPEGFQVRGRLLTADYISALFLRVCFG